MTTDNAQIIMIIEKGLAFNAIPWIVRRVWDGVGGSEERDLLLLYCYSSGIE